MTRPNAPLPVSIFTACAVAASSPASAEVIEFRLSENDHAAYSHAYDDFWEHIDASTGVSSEVLEARAPIVRAAADRLDGLTQNLYTQFWDQRDELTAASPTAMAFYSPEEGGESILGIIKGVRDRLGIDFSIIAVNIDDYPGIGEIYAPEGVPASAYVAYGDEFTVNFVADEWSEPAFYKFMTSTLADLSQSEPELELFVR